MTLGIDEQVLAEMAPLFAALGDSEAAPVGDVEARRVRRSPDVRSRRLLADLGSIPPASR
jgi:hypothetical protein